MGLLDILREGSYDLVEDLPESMADRGNNTERTELLQGPLDMLILRTLVFGPMHGHGIATFIERTSENVLQIDHGSLYPALQRLQRRGWITVKWGPAARSTTA
jgi:PadR family transcriptional regulator PadR